MARILIVDDSAFARNSLKAIVEGNGHEVVGRAENGREALILFTSLQPELVTLDYLMVGETGNEVLEKLIQIDSDAKVIMISGMGDPNIQERALQAGARCFLAKPYDDEVVLRVIDQTLAA
jgi:two-component system chemotaxis response regulator CheY